jgi:hypothetical protein
MVTTTDALRREALALPDPERADLATELLASLDKPATDDPETVSALWSDELDRRAKRVLSREATGEDWNSLHRRLVDELSG